MENKNIFMRVFFLASCFALAFIFSSSALAATATVNAGTATGIPGASVTIPINLTVDTVAVTSMVIFDITYDATKIQFPASTDDSRLLYGSAITNAMSFYGYAEESTPGTVSVALMEMSDPATGKIANGEILKLKFNILGGAAAGNYPLTITNVNILDKDSVAETVSATDGQITIEPGVVVITYGIADFLALVPNWLQAVPSSASDINKDGKVNSLDLGIMMSKWSIAAQ